MLNCIFYLLNYVVCCLYLHLYLGPKYLLKEHIIEKHKRPNLPENLKNKTVVVTGGSKGVGLGAVKQFIKLGCHVIVGCRNVSYAEEKFNQLFPEDAHKIKTYHLDLADWPSIQQFAQNVKSLGVDINILVNNAGVMKCCSRKETSDGHEWHFGCNFLGPVLLTHLLSQQLKQAAERSGEASRIVNVSSATHSLTAFFNGLEEVSLKKSYNHTLAYSNSKTAILIFSQVLNKKFSSSGTNIKVISLHPGIVFTELALEEQPRIVVEISKLFFKTADQGGDTLVHASLSPELESINLDGLYLENSRPVDIGSYGKDPTLQKKIWEEAKKCLTLENICGYL